MSNIDKAKSNTLVSAICYILLTLYTTIRLIFGGYAFHRFDLANVSYVLSWFHLFGFVIAFFSQNRKLLVFSAILGVLSPICYIIYAIINRTLIYYFIKYILNALAYSALIVVALFSVKKPVITQRIWFLPSILMVLNFVYAFVQVGLGMIYFDNHMIDRWLYAYPLFIEPVLSSIGLFFAGHWLKGDPLLTNRKNNAPITSSEIGGADRLKTFKELLDSGAITREEFDAKKKEILG